MDLVVQFEDQDGVFAKGYGEASVTGALTSGTAFQGTDEICVTQ